MAKAATAKSHLAPVIQFSVFVENKVGRLLEMVNLFRQHNLHIVALSIVDTTDSAINRMVVDDPGRARAIFDENAYAYSECPLIAIEMDLPETDLQRALSSLVQAECNVYFVYSFLTQPRGKSTIALHVDDNDLAAEVLQTAGFKLLSQNDISR